MMLKIPSIQLVLLIRRYADVMASWLFAYLLLYCFFGTDYLQVNVVAAAFANRRLQCYQAMRRATQNALAVLMRARCHHLQI